jgi:predicted esterase
VFVSHGVSDRVLPIGACSRRIVPELRSSGYDVRYVEFPGGHTIPAAVARGALEWLGLVPAAP